MKAGPVEKKICFKKNDKRADKAILLGKEHPILQRGCRNCLKSSSYLVELANTGKQMLELYYSYRYSLIILGRNLIDINSLLIVQQIRKNEQANSLPIITILFFIETSSKQISKDIKYLIITRFLIPHVQL